MGSNPLAGVPSIGIGGSGPGSGMYHYIMPQVTFIALMFIGILVVWYFFRHQHTKIIATAIMGTLVLVMILTPQALGPMVGWVAGLFQHL